MGHPSSYVQNPSQVPTWTWQRATWGHACMANTLVLCVCAGEQHHGRGPSGMTGTAGTNNLAAGEEPRWKKYNTDLHSLTPNTKQKNTGQRQKQVKVQ